MHVKFSSARSRKNQSDVWKIRPFFHTKRRPCVIRGQTTQLADTTLQATYQVEHNKRIGRDNSHGNNAILQVVITLNHQYLSSEHKRLQSEWKLPRSEKIVKRVNEKFFQSFLIQKLSKKQLLMLSAGWV